MPSTRETGEQGLGFRERSMGLDLLKYRSMPPPQMATALSAL